MSSFVPILSPKNTQKLANFAIFQLQTLIRLKFNIGIFWNFNMLQTNVFGENVMFSIFEIDPQNREIANWKNSSKFKLAGPLYPPKHLTPNLLEQNQAGFCGPAGRVLGLQPLGPGFKSHCRRFFRKFFLHGISSITWPLVGRMPGYCWVGHGFKSRCRQDNFSIYKIWVKQTFIFVHLHGVYIFDLLCPASLTCSAHFLMNLYLH